MMSLTQYFLIKIAEEAAEVAQIALKAAHFGLNEIQPGRTKTNAERMYCELNDLLAMVYRLGEVSNGEFSFDVGSPDHVSMATKLAKVEHYLAYSQSLGLVSTARCVDTMPHDIWQTLRRIRAGVPAEVLRGCLADVDLGDEIDALLAVYPLDRPAGQGIDSQPA
jgi:hypothetical protein